MGLVFLEVEAAFADPFLLEMDWMEVAMQGVLSLEMGEFDHFEPLWQFLRGKGVNNLYYHHDFLISPAQIVAASHEMNSL